MQQCILRHPSARLTLLGTRIGAKVAKAVLMSAAAGKLTPEILSEALMSSSTIRGHVQREVVKLLVVRVSLRTPQQLQWLLRLIGDCVGGLSVTGAISSLTQRSLLYQVANFGLRGSAASAITTAAVQVGLTTCTLVTTNAAFWRKGDHKMSGRQYRYELLTSLYAGIGSVAGGAAGAAVGSMVMPGVGTAFGSVLCSVGAGYLPGYVRDKKGPDDCRRRQATALREYTPYRMHDTREGAVLMYREDLVETPPAAVTEPAATGGVAAPPSAAYSVASSARESAELSDAASETVGNAARSSEVEMNSNQNSSKEEEEEEPVWLDFVRAKTLPQSAMNAPAVSSADSSARSSQSSWEDTASASGQAEGETTGLRSFLRFHPRTESPTATRQSGEQAGRGLTAASAGALSTHSSFADLAREEEEGEAEGAAVMTEEEDRRERFQGSAKYVTVHSEAELETEVAKFGGQDDLVLVFAEN